MIKYISKMFIIRFLIIVLCLCVINLDTSAQKQASGLKVDFKNFDVLLAEAESAMVTEPKRTLKITGSLLDFALNRKNDSLFLQVNRIAGLTYYRHGYFILWEAHCLNYLSKPFVQLNEHLEARLLDHLGIAYEIQGKFDKALTTYQTTRAIMLRNGDLHGFHASGLNKALLYERVKKFTKSKELIEASLDYFHEIGDTSFIALSYQNLGMIYERMLEYDSSYYYGRKSLELYTALKDTVKMADIHFNMAVSYLERRDAENLRFHINQASALIPEHLVKVNFLNFLKAEEAYFHGKYERADTLYDKALPGLKEVNDVDKVMLAYRGKILVASKTDHHDAVAALLIDLITFQRKTFNAVLDSRFAELEVKYENDLMQAEINEMQLINESQRVMIRWLFAFIGLFVLVAVIVSTLFFRLKNAYRKIYKLNLEVEKKTQFKTVGTPDSETTPANNNEDRLELYEQVLRIVSEKELYKNPKLTIQDLSKELVTNTKYLSQAINKHSEMNFNAFINEFRVNEVRRLLMDIDDLSMDEVADQAGFSHRSQLYRVFSASTGLTPVQYKNMKKTEKVNKL